MPPLTSECRTSRTTVSVIVTALALLFMCGCRGVNLENLDHRKLDSPASPGSVAPNLTVGLDNELYLSWIEPQPNGHRLRFSRWEEDHWSTARTIAEGANWFVNWADFPSMAALADGTLAAHWLAKSGSGTYAYNVHVALSHDGGERWSEPLVPHRDETESEHGFVSLVPTSEGNFDLVWLDGRFTTRMPRGAMTLRYATLSTAGQLSSESQIDDRICDCCSTDALRLKDGTFVVTYRDRSDSEVRDISISRSDNSEWSPPLTVHEDNWEIAACPVNGPAIANDRDLVAVAWFTAPEGRSAVRVAFSRDGGRTFIRTLRVDHGDPLGRVDVVLLKDGSAVVSWLEHDDGQARVVLRRVRPSGALESINVATLSPARSSGFPRMVRFGNEIVVVWTEAEGIASAALTL